MSKVVNIDGSFIENNTSYPTLVSRLKTAFSNSQVLIPQRHHHEFPNPKANADTTLLIMPAWLPGNHAGVKLVTVSPENHQFGLPSIQGTYIYFDSINGAIKAIIDAKSLTVKRTAATSALATSFLSRPDSHSLLMLGTGALSAELIKAHASVRPIKEVFVWGRSFEKAKSVAARLKDQEFSVSAVATIEEKIGEVCIVSCATLSREALVNGEYLKKGQHIDLVGSYKPDMREADDQTIIKSSVFVDTFDGALSESGDIVIPMKSGILKKEDIRADLFQLCSNQIEGRRSIEEITVFKSVGYALEDLVAAEYYYNQFTNG